MSVLVILLFGISSSFAHGALNHSPKVRRIHISKDQILKVFTSPTVATIIQVPDRPNSVVLGNQPGFQIEYLDTAVTIKPLSNSAKGNLYIYTDYRRYNIELVTTDSARADYIVYLLDKIPEAEEGKSRSSPTVKWSNYSNRTTTPSFVMQTTRIGKTSDHKRFIEFKLSSDRNVDVDPALFWITQGGKEKPIHNLYLSSLRITRDTPINGSIALLDQDFKKEEIRIELRGKKAVGHAIPKGALWK